MLVLFAGAMILSAVVISSISWWKLNASISERSKIRTLILSWEQLGSTLRDAETGQRGFLLTGDDAYLAPFTAAEKALPGQFQLLERREIEWEDEYGPAELLELRQTADRKIDELRETITVFKRENLQAAIEMVKSGKGKQIMDDIRAELNLRLDQLHKGLEVQSAIMQRDLLWTFYSVAGTALASFLAGFLAWRLLRESEVQARREERLAAEKRRAEQADREKSIFLATMSHEIRTPMNAILGFGELLAADAKADKEKRYAQSIVRSGHSLLQIINDILDLSKIEAGMMDIHPEPTDLRELASFVQQLFTTQAVSRGLEMRVEFQEDLPSSLMVDSTRLRQILINLAGNAFKFTEQGHVLLRFSGHRETGARSQLRLIIEVSDTGVGIPPEQMTEIFKPFVQAKVRREMEHRGTGLGLAIVKRLVRLMSGNVSVQSELGKGSTFRLDFPAVDISARLPKSAIQDEPPVDFNELSPAEIMVVDDNPVNRELVRGFFEGTHHQVREASDGREALTAMLEKRPDVVLMDIRMPVMDGRTALRALRDQKSLDLLPVIAVTASSMAGEEGMLRETFDGYVRKPFSRSTLFKELAQFIPRLEDKREPRLPAGEASALPGWRELVGKLHDLKTSTWPSVRDGMVLAEVSSFAERLTQLSLEYECPPLENYAAGLAAQCQSFSPGEIEKTVETFPGLITQIERRLAS